MFSYVHDKNISFLYQKSLFQYNKRVEKKKIRYQDFKIVLVIMILHHVIDGLKNNKSISTMYYRCVYVDL